MLSMAKLLKGGVALIHDEFDNITPSRVDILIHHDRIVQVDKNIAPLAQCEVVDCTDKIISPGFVDAHHHLWQTMLKGLFGNSQFLRYLAIINILGLHMTPEDVFWGTLAGSMEAIDAGTTTVLDHAQVNWTRDHSKPAVAAILTSGIRAIFAYTPAALLKSTSPPAFEEELLPSWVFEGLQTLSKTQPLSLPSSRVKLGLGFDLWFLPKEAVHDAFAKAHACGATTITSHYVRWSKKTDSLVHKANEWSVLDSNLILAHAGGATQEEVDLLLEKGAFVATTPSTEKAMSVGPSTCFNKDLVGGDKVTALGVDCHCVTSSSIPGEMRLALQSARGDDSATHRRNGVIPQQIFHTTCEAFNLGSIQGARALQMDKDIGSIAVGKKADLVIFDALTPSMLGVAQMDPISAVVLHSAPADIEAVLVDGEFRKRNGKLLNVSLMDWSDEERFVDNGRQLSWQDVSRHLLDVQSKAFEFIERPETNLAAVEDFYFNMYSQF